MATNKVVLGDETLIDLTADTVTASTLSNGITAHSASGEFITGTLSGNNMYLGSEEPTDDSVVVWINTEGSATEYATKAYVDTAITGALGGSY